jgi:hypothetical protein
LVGTTSLGTRSSARRRCFTSRPATNWPSPVAPSLGHKPGEGATPAKGFLVPKSKMQKVMWEYKRGTLHSGSKKGPKVTSRKQAVAIAMSEQRRAKKSRGKRGK